METDVAANTLSFWPLLFYTVGALIVLGVMYGLSWITGQRHSDRETNDPYESGVKITGSARVRYPVQFYLVAMLFVIFDLEVAFIFGWAVVAKKIGWMGYTALLVFVLILVVGLIYEWRQGALDFISEKLYRVGKKNR